ncbi:MAG: hypothetical protein E6J74_41875 [Deltaproteobacteria bacterium]|nr:MAG: hypothetical protein E6J74_41875 [Deltaproteobacteria bacterium]
MFVETYRLEAPPVGGGTSRTTEAIPYPTISDDDWKVWTAFLPVRTEIDEKFLRGASPRLYAQTLPPKVRDELQRANRFFDRVEVWGKREIEKDPIAVGYQGNDRYLIARWGMEKLVQSLPLILAYKYGIYSLRLLAGLAGLSFLVWNLLA